MRLEGEVAIVTGSTRGIGRRIARRFAAEGAKTVVTGRTGEAGERVVQELEKAGGTAMFVRCDITQEADVERLVETVTQAYGPVTVLINNAAATEMLYGATRLDDVAWNISLDAWNRMTEQMITGPFLTTKYAVPKMIEAGYGSIVNVSSVVAGIVIPAQTAYAAFKNAVQGLTLQVAMDAGEHNIRCNCIQVGFCPTPDDDLADTSEAAIEINQVTRLTSDINSPAGSALANATMLRRLGTAEDIAAYALHLASSDSAYQTGTIVPIDGGATSKLSAIDFRQKGYEAQ